MSLSFPYRTTSHGHYQCSGRGALGRWKVSSHLPQYLWTLLHCICLVSGLQFKVVSALFSSPLFHFLSLIEVFLQPKCFLMECSANYSFNKTLLWTLIFSLNGGFFFSNGAEKLISWGSRATVIKRYGLEEHTLRSAWVGVCVLLALS